MYEINLIEIVDLYANWRGISVSRVCNLAVQDGKFIERLRNGRTCTLRLANQLLRWLSDRWPAGLAWPAEVERPSPVHAQPPITKSEVVALVSAAMQERETAIEAYWEAVRRGETGDWSPVVEAEAKARSATAASTAPRRSASRSSQRLATPNCSSIFRITFTRVFRAPLVCRGAGA